MFSFSRRAGPLAALASAMALTMALTMVVYTPSAHAQSAATPAAAAAAVKLKVGDMAPDFTVTTVTAKGVETKPFKLSEHRGETVVLAFFPRARTSGCTMQMEAYRDQYANLFQDGKKVTLIGVSVDPDTALVAWAKDANFQFKFATDMDRHVGMAFGANKGTGVHSRHLYVIDPSGKIAYMVTPFLQMSADAYTELGNAVKQANAGH